MWLTPEGAAAEVRNQESSKEAQTSHTYDLFMTDFTVQELLEMNNDIYVQEINKKGSFSQPGSSGAEGPSSSAGAEGRLEQVVRTIATRERPSGECKEYKHCNYSYHLSKRPPVEGGGEMGQGYIGFYRCKYREILE